MVKYIFKRIAFALLTFLIIVSLCFVLIKLLPITDAAQFGQDASVIETRRKLLGYYDPLPKQYVTFLTKTLFGGDWGVGEQIYRTKDVWEIFVEKLPPTMLLNVYSMVFAVPLGLAFGIYAALKKNKWQDHFISTVVILFVSIPSYVYAFLVQFIFGFLLDWFPLTVYSLADAGGSWFTAKMFSSMVLPVLALSFGEIAGLCRFTRAELTETLTSDYMLLARTKGLTRTQATTRHALKNAMVPILPSIIASFIGILGGSMIIEQIFSVPGVGQLFIQSIQLRDYDVFMMDTVFYTFIGLLAGIVVDISYGFIDPRIRMGAKK